MRPALLAAPILLLAAGCTQYWAKPGGSRSELQAATDRCDTEALTRFPLAPLYGGPAPGSNTVSATQCTFGPSGPGCTTYDDMEVDVNGAPRMQAFRACMIAGGWLPARDDDDVAAITRMRHPVGPPPAFRIQEARAWCEARFLERRDAQTMAVFHNSLEQCIATHSRDFG